MNNFDAWNKMISCNWSIGCMTAYVPAAVQPPFQRYGVGGADLTPSLIAMSSLLVLAATAISNFCHSQSPHVTLTMNSEASELVKKIAELSQLPGRKLYG